METNTTTRFTTICTMRDRTAICNFNRLIEEERERRQTELYATMYLPKQLCFEKFVFSLQSISANHIKEGRTGHKKMKQAVERRNHVHNA